MWHDNHIMPEKCIDTHPVVSCLDMFEPHPLIHVCKFPGDPMYPYVGKFIANLTLAQIKSLDCGSKRQSDFRMALFIFESHDGNLDRKPNNYSIPELAYQHCRKFLILWSVRIPRIRSYGI